METILKTRPKLLTIVCVIGFIWIVFSFPAVFSPSVKKLGDWFPAMFGLLVAFNFIAYIGVWHLKRWGVNLFIFTFFVKQTLYVLINDISYVGIALSVLSIITMLFYYKRLDVNL